MNISDQLARALSPISHRIRMMVARVVVRAIDDATKMQTAKVGMLANEVADGMERVQQYGFTSVPLPGAEGIALFIGGNRDHGVIIAVDDRRYRLKAMEAGEVALYTDEDAEDGGQRIVLRRGQKTEIHSRQIYLKAADVLRLEGNKVEIIGGTSLQIETHGYGTRTTWAGGTAYTVDGYSIGAVITDNPLAISPPALPSEYPA